MWQVLSKHFDEFALFATVGILVLGGTVVALVAIWAQHRRAMHQASLDASLKQDMLRRGLAVEEIERVLRASAVPPEKPDPVSDNLFALTEKMIEEGRSGADIERVIGFLKSTGGSVSDNEHALIEKMLDEGKPADEIERVVRAFRQAPPAAPVGATEVPAGAAGPRETSILRLEA